MSIIRLIVGFLVLGVGLGACSYKDSEDRPSGSRHFFDAMMGSSPYEKIWDQNTQVEFSHSSFETVMRAEVTHWNLALREAYIEEVSRVYRLPLSERQALEVQEFQEEENYETFIVSLTTKHYHHNDLNKTNSAWRIQVESADGAQKVPAARIELISNKKNHLQEFYRNMNNFNRTYRVLFPKRSIPNELFYLYLTGPYGQARFEFKPSQAES